MLTKGVLMKLHYLPINFNLKFKTSVYSDTYPAFVLRAIMGKELRRFACILKTKKCDECPLKFQCAYSYIFESPIDKNNEFIKGRDKASHPFVLTSKEDINREFEELNFNLTLFGRGIDYFPYIFYAFLKAGENGIFKRRYIYEILKVESGEFLVNDGSSDYLEIPEKSIWELNPNISNKQNKKVILTFLTPLRLKINGKYNSKIKYNDLLRAIIRRVNLFCGLYGEFTGEEKLSENLKKLSEKKEFSSLTWKEYSRYSARQDTRMKLGGAVGQMEVEGDFTDFELSLLKFISIAGLGKNTGFGFGKIKVEVEND
jgi:CRISPR-associated endoribonuclease Cas6